MKLFEIATLIILNKTRLLNKLKLRYFKLIDKIIVTFIFNLSKFTDFLFNRK